MKKLQILFIVCFASNIFTLPLKVDADKYSELAKFIEKYRCSTDIEKQAVQELLKNNWDRNNRFFFKRNGNRFFGYTDDFIRIINARRLKNYFKQNGFECMDVAEKCLCYNDDQLDVVACGVRNIEPEKKITLSEIKQLAAFAEETGFSDWARDIEFFGYTSAASNVHRDRENKFVFIDTEYRSFAMGWKNDCKFNRINSLMMYCRDNIEPEALQWLESRLAELDSLDGKKECPSVLLSAKYDDLGINFARVEREFYLFRQDEFEKSERAFR